MKLLDAIIKYEVKQFFQSSKGKLIIKMFIIDRRIKELQKLLTKHI